MYFSCLDIEQIVMEQWPPKTAKYEYLFQRSFDTIRHTHSHKLKCTAAVQYRQMILFWQSEHTTAIFWKSGFFCYVPLTYSCSSSLSFSLFLSLSLSHSARSHHCCALIFFLLFVCTSIFCSNDAATTPFQPAVRTCIFHRPFYCCPHCTPV